MEPFPKTPLSPAPHVQNSSRVPPPPPLISSLPLSVSSSPPPSLLTSAYSKIPLHLHHHLPWIISSHGPPPPSTNTDCVPPILQPPPESGMPSLPPTPGQGVLSQSLLGCGILIPPSSPLPPGWGMPAPPPKYITSNSNHDENVWNEQLAANPKIAPYRRGVETQNWEDICSIFSEDCADKGDERTFQEVNDEIGVDYSTTGDSLDSCDEKVDVRDSLAQQKLKKTTSSSNTQGRKKKSSMDKLISDCMKQMTTAFSDYLVVERKKSELVIAEKELMLAEKKKLNVQEIVAELKTFYLNDMQIIKALDLMMHDRILFDMFAGMPTELKYKWLKVQLDKGS
ncbi:protein ALTERED PHOSPHATE STARVATION RESPONSE 1-like [Salvia hispanica]|uniref:protein ALTERED PHOSPHATE STARVATION RESPONSE 1-like n=1 Tax=Salvia hispanica TaxID=49212 RepID=UPI0020099D82|nr:protein ALTERED PHOSPHATE STARVATION RESPONSE 1-like [Salvia hispanica]